jgi:hypothetical protein
MNTQNTKLQDVVVAFDNTNTDGTLHQFDGEPWVATMAESHVQGLARYGNYILLSHNNKGYSLGFICALNVTSKKLAYTFDTPDAHYNHPGGMQVIGDFLVVGVESSDYSKSYLHFYDLSSMTDTVHPAFVPFNMARNAGAGAVGITSYTDNQVEYYLLAVYDNGHMDFYKSNGNPISNPDFKDIWFSTTVATTDYSSINLLTDVNQDIWMVGFRTRDLATSKDDYVDLYRIDPQTRQVSSRTTRRHMVTKYGGIEGMDGVHFRWGAGLQIISDDSLTFFATQRNFVGNNFYTNTFDVKALEPAWT